MPGGRPKKPLILSKEEREILRSWTRRRKISRQLAMRARIVLLCGSGMNNLEVASELDVTDMTVGKWRERFRVHRLQGLNDEHRSGPPPSVADEKLYEVVAKTLETKPANATHWSTRSMAKETGLSQSTVGRIWRTFGLQPHREKTFKLSTDPLFVEKVHDVVGLYMNPPDRAVVLSIDEKSQIQALDRSQPLLPMMPGTPERRTHDYIRHGTTTLFAALDVKTGRVIGECQDRHRHQEFLRFLNRVDRVMKKTHPPETQIHIVMDNYATHKTPKVKQWFARRPQYHVHFTPTSASWLNQIERFFADITTKRIRRGVFKGVKQLIKAIYDYLEEHNIDPKPFIWTATSELILDRVARAHQSIRTN
jgi:transposase